jgi:hypothetical protein
VSVTVIVSLSVTFVGGGPPPPELVAVPESETVCVLPATPLLLSVMVRAPVSMPAGAVSEGEKVTLIVQEPPARTLPPQLSDSPKLALMPMLAMVSAAVPVVLLSVTGCDALVVPRF